jgi:hypothetical protein
MSPEADIRVPYFSAPLASITPRRQAAVKSVRIIRCLVLLAGALGLWSCAAAKVGLQGDGSYILERSEQSADCQGLYKNIWGRIQVLKGLPAKAKIEQATPPATASSLFGRLFGGPSKGLDAVTEYNRERAHAYAVQRTMAEKKCVAVDLDRELAEVDLEMAQVRKN